MHIHTHTHTPTTWTKAASRNQAQASLLPGLKTEIKNMKSNTQTIGQMLCTPVSAMGSVCLTFLF